MSIYPLFMFKSVKRNSLISVLFSYLLTGTCTITSSAQTLKSIANDKGVYIGTIMSSSFVSNTNHDGGAQNNIVRSEFNTLVLENDMKMSYVIPNRPSNPFSFGSEAISKGKIDNFLKYCKNDVPTDKLRTRGHTLLWFNQAPGWLTNDAKNWTSKQVYDFTYQYIKAVASYCGNRIDEWDVINEVLHDGSGIGPFRSGTWYDKAATNQAEYDNYFKFCFETAREFAPNAKLLYNDYSIERYNSSSSSKNARMRDFVTRLKNAGAPIDAVGFQSHFTLSEMTTGDNINTGFISGVKQSMEFLDNIGLDVAITELDIRKCGSGTDAASKAAFKEITKMALSQPNCNTVLIWGISDKDSWIPQVFSGCGDALLYNNNYVKKNSYFGVSEALSELPNIGEFTNKITKITAPDIITQGQKILLSVDVESAGNNELVLMLQLDGLPYTVYQEKRTPVAKGKSTIVVELTVGFNVPVAIDAYQFQFYLAPTAGGWDDRLADLNKMDIDVKQGIVKVQEPYLGVITIPGTVQAEHFDKGGLGVSYNDSDTENMGATGSNFRVDEEVDVAGSTNDYSVGWTADGEWLEYSVNVQETGKYNVEFFVTSLPGGGMLGLKLDDQVILTGALVPATGGWNTVSTFKKEVDLTSGNHILRLDIEKSGFNIDKMVFQKVVPTNTEIFLETNLIDVYPNPSDNGIFHLSEKVDFEVFDLSGNLILNDSSDKVDLTTYQKGVYVLSFGSSKVKMIRK